MAKQTLRFENGDYNLRKLNQLPHHLIEAGELIALKTQCLCNYEFLLARLCGTSYGYVRKSQQLIGESNLEVATKKVTLQNLLDYLFFKKII